jgi:hypothetical protein
MNRETTTQLSYPILELPKAKKRRLGLSSALCCAWALAWAGCSSIEPTPITGPVQTKETSIEYVQSGHDTLGRNWNTTPPPAPKPAPPPPEPRTPDTGVKLNVRFLA